MVVNSIYTKATLD